MKKWICGLLVALTALTCCACKAQEEAAQSTTEAVIMETTESQESRFDSILQAYGEAVKQNFDPAQMVDAGLNYMIPGCIAQDERARVGYFLGDLNGDGVPELAVAASSESEFYTGLIFELYILEDGQPVLLAESSERNRWYYAGSGKLLNVASSSAAESGWYLCSADRDLAYLDGAECNGVQYPEDPWLSFTGDTWIHISQEEASRKILEFTNFVSNLEICPFS